MRTSELIRTYLAARRAHGTRLRSGERALYQFARETGDQPLAQVPPAAVATFLRGRGELSATWTARYQLLAGLYRFALARGHVSASALPEQRPKLPPPITAYVYSRAELQRLLDATAVLDSPFSRMQALTYRTLILTLYGSGLRVGEALRLNLVDVDLVERVLTVHETKFYKSRLVPVSGALAAALAAYTRQRCSLSMPLGAASAFFASRSGHRIDYQRVVTLFQRVRTQAGIGCPSGVTRPPRLHDLRHTAAVHRVLAWYRESKDVQQLLPKLATYLGHASIASTQHYLQMTPELLHEASLRFAAYADTEAGEVVAHA
ncbi:MAG: tyrosine-type recombinase/integrase [Burkholderiaceae bacterium]|nr:tyrosine-type recombinase/integrase [Burkholderiaceae bacterium]